MSFLRTVTRRYGASQRKLPVLYLVWRKNKRSRSAQFSDYFTGQKHKKVLKLHSQVIGFYAPVARMRLSHHGALEKKKLPERLRSLVSLFPPRSDLRRSLF